MEYRVHDRELLDAIEAIPPTEYHGSVWRVCIQGRSPVIPSTAPGRWNDNTFSVLYTSLEADTAKAEVHFHVYQKNSVPPSKLVHVAHELAVQLNSVLKLLDVSKLNSLGVTEKEFYGKDFIAVRKELYPKTQAIGAAARFLEFDGLQVPSARISGQNLVLFTDNILPANEISSVSSEQVDLRNWQSAY